MSSVLDKLIIVWGETKIRLERRVFTKHVAKISKGVGGGGCEVSVISRNLLYSLISIAPRFSRTEGGMEDLLDALEQYPPPRCLHHMDNVWVGTAEDGEVVLKALLECGASLVNVTLTMPICLAPLFKHLPGFVSITTRGDIFDLEIIYACVVLTKV
jgi:hypothetical protein